MPNGHTTLLLNRYNVHVYCLLPDKKIKMVLVHVPAVQGEDGQRNILASKYIENFRF